MRTIKFRGFNAKNNQWLYGSHIINREKHFVAPDEFADDKTWEDYEVEPETIGQFTGLYDKNGKEVYEGDIIEWTETHYHAIGVVAWREQIGLKDTEEAYNVGWCVEEYKGKVTYIIAPSAVPHGVVVGNVHDNYELLKGEQE